MQALQGTFVRPRIITNIDTNIEPSLFGGLNMLFRYLRKAPIRRQPRFV